LAELPVTDVQIGDFDSPENGMTLSSSGDDLRIVHCSRDQIVKIESLDVECAPHPGAARAQLISHGLLIRNRIEGRPRLGPGCYLAERQSNGEDFDKNDVHQAPNLFGLLSNS